MKNIIKTTFILGFSAAMLASCGSSSGPSMDASNALMPTATTPAAAAPTMPAEVIAPTAPSAPAAPVTNETKKPGFHWGPTIKDGAWVNTWIPD